MKWRFRGREVVGNSGVLLVSACVMVATSPPTVRGDTAPIATSSKATEVLPPGALVWRGPNAGAATSATSTNASAALSVVPTSLRLPADLAEVVRLQTAGTSEDTILAFIQNSPPLSPLTPAQIVYLKDLGVSPRVLLAMLQHQRQPSGETSPASVPTFPGAGVAAVPQAPTPDSETEEMGPGVPEGYDTAAELPGPGYFNPIDYGYVYGALSPYGAWHNLAGFGWCWQPTVCAIDHGWRPYCDNGRWRWSDCGWYWDSNYTWGRVPFHYGRWWQHPQQGWLWRPDRVWAPAWVSWRSAGDRCGWAPLPPGADFSVGSGWSFRGRPTDPARGGFGLTASSYTFVDRQHFLKPAGHRLGASETQEAFRHSTPAERNGFVLGADQRIVNAGMDPFRVQTAAHTAARPAAVAVNFPGGASFTDKPSSGQLPFNLRRHTDRSGGANAENASATPAATEPSGGTVWGKASAWGNSGSADAHVPQYPAARSLAELGNGPLPMQAQPPAAPWPRPGPAGKATLVPNAPAGGGTVVFPFAKPGAVAPVAKGGAAVSGGGGRK